MQIDKKLLRRLFLLAAGVSRFCVDSAGYGAGEQRGEVAVESDIAVCGGRGHRLRVQRAHARH